MAYYTGMKFFVDVLDIELPQVFAAFSFYSGNINNQIVEGLKEQKQITGETTEITALRRKEITSADYKFASSFNPGDILKFNKSYKNGIEKGDYLKIKKISQVSNALILEKESNGKTKELLYNLKKNYQF
jgi:hypothetical protein